MPVALMPYIFVLEKDRLLVSDGTHDFCISWLMIRKDHRWAVSTQARLPGPTPHPTWAPIRPVLAAEMCETFIFSSCENSLLYCGYMHPLSFFPSVTYFNYIVHNIYMV